MHKALLPLLQVPVCLFVLVLPSSEKTALQQKNNLWFLTMIIEVDSLAEFISLTKFWLYPSLSE